MTEEEDGEDQLQIRLVIKTGKIQYQNLKLTQLWFGTWQK